MLHFAKAVLNRSVGVWRGHAPTIVSLARRPNGPLALAVALLIASLMPLSSQAAELTTIQKRGYLIVGVKDNLRPLGFRTSDGTLAGLEIDLAHYLAEQLLGDANAVKFQPMANTARLSAVMNDEVDLAIAQLGVTGSRARLVDFSTPYYLDGTALITRDHAAHALKDVEQGPIAVLDRSSTIAVIRYHLPNAQLIPVQSYQDAKAALENGRAIAFAADLTVLSGWVQEYPDYHLLPALFAMEALSVAMPRGVQYSALRQQVDEAIRRWQGNGSLKQRVLYWGLPDTGNPTTLPNQDSAP